MKIIADESVDGPIVQRLRAEGHDVVYVAEEDSGTADEAVLRSASESNSLLITSDKDFGEIVFRQGRASHGVLLFRLSGLSNSTKADLASWALEKHGKDLRDAFAVLTPQGLRLRKG